MFGHTASALLSAQSGDLQFTHLPSFRSVSEPTANPSPPPPQVRLHPGVVVSVVFVTIAAILAAAFIIRKYCFSPSEASYRYSVLRQMEEHRAAAAAGEEDESDEDLLE
ncbi:hypothetical protein AMEX_G6980 [Astyanax mexicanus]|uniref:Uncharacterized protein n=1 Tax=Astyanax mexicanus TaxID=7994 RepID=A0A8T2LZZ5_ASTMX|nr:hypothetical protein AMEX_G6980 [Astyanax mexicanus]